MTFIILPVVPDAAIGPGGGVNPREVWLIAIVLAAVSFLGYGAVKLFGAQRGVLLSGLAGGLVSSTAVTLTSARRAAAHEGSPLLLTAGVAAASAVSFLCVVAIVGVMQPALLIVIAPVLVPPTVVAGLYAVHAVYWRGAASSGATPRPSDFANPFSFWPVVGFAVFLGVVILLGRVIGDTFGAQGALLGAAGLGLADVDAVTISLARLMPVPLDQFAAGLAILAAVASNMLSKLVVAIAVGRGRFAAEVAVVTAACWIAGGGALCGVMPSLVAPMPH